MPLAPKSPPKKVTIFEVAKQAGVSIKTVSRVVNNESNVRDTTRAKVRSAIRKLNYKPNAAARELSSKRSRLMGLIYENAQEFNYMKDVLDGTLDACEARGYSLLLCPLTLPNSDVSGRVRDFATQARVEGVVLPAPLGDLGAAKAPLRQLQVPFAVIAPKDSPPDAIEVGCNDGDATCALVEHLVEQGHRAIGFIKGHPDHGASVTRFAGYRDALKRHGLAFQESLVRQGYFDFDSGKAAASALLELENPPSAIVASNDDMAAGVLFDARERGLSVPGDLSVVGFDDTQIASRLWPPLTTVRQPIVKMAETATRLLIEQLNGEAVESPKAPFECEVVIRKSTSRVV